MRVKLVRVGNSRSIRIPETILARCGFGDTVELRVENRRLVVAADRSPRQSWKEAFRAAGSAEEDEMLFVHATPLDIGNPLCPRRPSRCWPLGALPVHSWRSAVVGSMRVALVAGPSPATSKTNSTRMGAAR